MSKGSKEFEEIKETGFIFKSVKHLNLPPPGLSDFCKFDCRMYDS